MPHFRSSESPVVPLPRSAPSNQPLHRDPSPARDTNPPDAMVTLRQQLPGVEAYIPIVEQMSRQFIVLGPLPQALKQLCDTLHALMDQPPTPRTPFSTSSESSDSSRGSVSRPLFKILASVPLSTSELAPPGDAHRASERPPCLICEQMKARREHIARDGNGQVTVETQPDLAGTINDLRPSEHFHLPAEGPWHEFYVVTIGRAVGIFTSGKLADELTDGLPHAMRCWFSDRAPALAFWQKELEAGEVTIIW